MQIFFSSTVTADGHGRAAVDRNVADGNPVAEGFRRSSAVSPSIVKKRILANVTYGYGNSL